MRVAGGVAAGLALATFELVAGLWPTLLAGWQKHALLFTLHVDDVHLLAEARAVGGVAACVAAAFADLKLGLGELGLESPP